MSSIKLVQHILKDNTFKIENMLEKENQLYILKLKKSPEYKEEGYIYFKKRIKEKTSDIGITDEGGYITFVFTKRDNETYEILLDALKKKYFMIEEPEKEEFTIIAKITARCNLSCAYCYDQDFRAKLSHCGNLPLEDLDKVIRLAGLYAKKVQVILHGGEPTMTGVDYVRSVAEDIVTKYPYCEYDVCMQTNGLALNDEWKKMLKEKGIGIGISYSAKDPLLRFRPGQEKTVLKNIKEFIDAGVCSGVIDVVTNTTIKDVKEIYEFYKNEKIPQNLNLVYTAPEVEEDMILKAEGIKEYKEVAADYFTYWANDKDAKIERFASLFIERILAATGGTCNNHGTCVDGLWLGINANGEIYPCDSDYPDKYRIANIKEIDSLHELYSLPPWTGYNKERKELMKRCEESCVLFPYCNSGCPANDVMATGSAGIKNKDGCTLFRTNMLCAYIALSRVSLDSANKYLRYYLLKNNCILPGEINSLLRYLGIKEEVLNYEFKETLFDKNFELFMAINHYDGGKRIIGPADAMWDIEIPEDEEEIKDERFENIKKALLSKGKTLFESLIFGENNPKE